MKKIIVRRSGWLLVFLLFAMSVLAAEPTPDELRLEIVRSQRQAAISDFARGQTNIENGQLLMQDAQKRVQELNAQEKVLVEKIEAGKEKESCSYSNSRAVSN